MNYESGMRNYALKGNDMIKQHKTKMIDKKKREEDLEITPSRWQRRERKAKPKMRVHGRRLKELARKLSEKQLH